MSKGQFNTNRFVIQCQTKILGPVAQSVATQTADQEVRSLFSACSHTFMKIDLEVLGHSPPSTDSRRVVVSYK